jgi:hypothetical protein
MGANETRRAHALPVHRGIVREGHATDETVALETKYHAQIAVPGLPLVRHRETQRISGGDDFSDWAGATDDSDDPTDQRIASR